MTHRHKLHRGNFPCSNKYSGKTLTDFCSINHFFTVTTTTTKERKKERRKADKKTNFQVF